MIVSLGLSLDKRRPLLVDSLLSRVILVVIRVYHIILVIASVVACLRDWCVVLSE